MSLAHGQELDEDHLEARKMLKNLTPNSLSFKSGARRPSFSSTMRFEFYNQSYPFDFKVTNNMPSYGKAQFIIKQLFCEFKYVNKLGRSLPDGTQAIGFDDRITYGKGAALTANRTDCVRKALCYVSVGIKNLPDENHLPYLMDVRDQPRTCLTDGWVDVSFD